MEHFNIRFSQIAIDNSFLKDFMTILMPIWISHYNTTVFTSLYTCSHLFNISFRRTTRFMIGRNRGTTCNYEYSYMIPFRYIILFILVNTIEIIFNQDFRWGRSFKTRPALCINVKRTPGPIQRFETIFGWNWLNSAWIYLQGRLHTEFNLFPKKDNC